MEARRLARQAFETCEEGAPDKVVPGQREPFTSGMRSRVLTTLIWETRNQFALLRDFQDRLASRVSRLVEFVGASGVGEWQHGFDHWFQPLSKAHSLS